MYIMDNGNDPPARIPFLKISDEKHDSNKQWPNNDSTSDSTSNTVARDDFTKLRRYYCWAEKLMLRRNWALQTKPAIRYMLVCTFKLSQFLAHYNVTSVASQTNFSFSTAHTKEKMSLARDTSLRGMVLANIAIKSLV